MTWDFDAGGSVTSRWAGRAIIRSSAQLAYSHAQAIIDGSFDAAACPARLHDGATWDEVRSRLLASQHAARQCSMAGVRPRPGRDQWQL
jgi:exoribonuclease R